MKTNNTSSTSRLLRFVSAGALALGLTATAFAQGTAFTYQGRLTDGVNPATGIYDLSFTLYDSAGGAGTVGRPVPKLGVGVTNGLFTVALEFGAGLFNGAALWLEIAAKTNGASVYVTLSPRQPLTPAPYALYAPAAGSVPAAGLIGMLPDAHLSANVALLDSNPVFDGSVTAADELVGLRLQIGVACEAGAIVTSPERFATALKDWFESGPRTGALAGSPYEDFDAYVGAYCNDIAACTKSK